MRPPETGLYLPARGKLNLVLRVVGRRADGYHLLETLFHAIDLHDGLWLARAEAGDRDITLGMSVEEERYRVSAGPDNLIVRAVDCVRQAAGVSDGFHAHLHKRIPVGGGLGGGSSNAAAAMRLSNALLTEPLPADQLHAIATSLGADVPFFLRGGSQWGRGVGTELSPAQVPASEYVLIVPPFDCPTAEVYKNYSPCWIDGGPQAMSDIAPIPTTRESALRAGFRNDLRQAAEVVRPALSALRQRAADLGKVSVHLTGSGSTLFVACADQGAADACKQNLAPLIAEGVSLLRTSSALVVDNPKWEAWPGAEPPTAGPGGV